MTLTETVFNLTYKFSESQQLLSPNRQDNSSIIFSELHIPAN
jgi:hypothetical protein